MTEPRLKTTSNPTEPTEAVESAGFDIMLLLRRVLRRPHVVIACVLVGILAGGELLTLIAPRYTSSAQILIDPKTPGSFGAASDFANLYIDTARVESVLTVLQSADLLNRVIDAQHLAQDPEFAGNSPSPIFVYLRKLHLAPESRLPPDTVEAAKLRALAHLVHALKVTRVGMTYVVEVAVTASTPTKAQSLTQAIANAYLDEQTRSKSAAAQRDYAWLLAKLAETRSNLKANEEAVEAVRRKFGLAEVDPDSRSKTDQETVQTINTQLLEADADVASRRASYEQAAGVLKSGGDVGSLPQFTSSPVFLELAKQRDTLLQQISSLEAHYKPAFPGLIEAKRDQQALENAVRIEGARLVENLRNDYEAAAAKRQSLANALARQTNDADSPAKAEGHVELRDAERGTAAAQSLYEALLGKLRDVEQQLARHDPEARIISPAFEPDSPSFPKPILLVGGGAGFGAMCGIGLALVRPVREKGFSNALDAESRLSLPVLGILPELPRYGRRTRHVPMHIPAYVVTRPLSQFVECLRALRTSLGLGASSGPRVIQLTSALPGEGKSTIASALAMSAAISGLRTALVDVDIRRPSIAWRFDLAESKGLTDILQDNVPCHDAQHVHRTLPLTIIPAGSIESPLPDMVATPQFADLIRTLASEHDLVILDSPPALAVSDPLTISKVVDATLLVVESQRTPKPVIERAMKALRAANAPLIGMVFNRAKAPGSEQHPYGCTMYESYRSLPQRLSRT